MYNVREVEWSVKTDSRDSKTIGFVKNACMYRKPMMLLE